VSEHVRTLTAAGWEADVLGSKGLYLVDFWASWCPPCRKLSPLVDALAAEKAGVLQVGKLNVDDEPGVAERYGISSIPTLLLFRDGTLIDQRVGALPLADLRQLVEVPATEARAATA
jgi:thioredoxin 1